jgi:2-polyprenyl-3-methyl-5-hydroxy-6-metoxy-1,4-benzoquinol methylase
MRFPSLDYVPVEEWLLSQVKGRSVLHLGCAGDYLRFGQEACLHYQIAKASNELYGVELDQSALEAVKKWVPEDESGTVRYFNADVQRLDCLEGKQFEIILAGSIIEHLSNPGLMLEKFTSLCKPEGKIIIVTPHVFGLLQFLRVAFYRREAVNTQHTCWFSISTLTELCSRYGLVPVEWHTGYGWRPHSLKWSIQKRIGVQFFRLFPHLGGSLIGVFKLRQYSQLDA